MTIPQRLSLYLACASLVSLAAFAWISASKGRDSLDPLQRALLTEVARAHARKLQAHIHGLGSDVGRVARLTDEPELLHVAERSGALPPDFAHRVMGEFSSLMLKHPHLLQVHLLVGARGRELLRIERQMSGDVIRWAPPSELLSSELQDDGDHNALSVIRSAQPGQLVFPEVAASRGRAAGSWPLHPVLHAGMTLGHSDGLLLIDVDMRPALGSYKELGDGSVGLYLALRDGRYLVHPRSSQAVFEEFSGISVAEEFPRVSFVRRGELRSWSGLTETGAGQVMYVVGQPIRFTGGQSVMLLAAASAASAGFSWHLVEWAILLGLLMSAASALSGHLLGRPWREPLGALLAYVRGDGQRRALPTSADGLIGELAVALRSMEARVSEQYAHLRQMIMDAPTPMVLLGSELKILLANRRAQALFGYDEPLLGHSVEMLMPQSLSAFQTRFLRRQLVSVESTDGDHALKALGRRRQGQELALELGISVVTWEGERALLVSGVDMTERQRVEDELRRSNEALQQFAYVASHDLQEPLRTVANYTELLSQRYQDKLDQRAQDYLRFAADGARRLQRLVADLLAYARVGSSSAPCREVDTQAVVSRVLDSLRARFEETHAVVDVDELPLAMCDETELFQVFQNLMGNAIKYVGVSEPRVWVSARPQGHMIRFSVKDNGLGMDMRFHDQAFHMFQRLDTSRGTVGSGIGLAIAKRIVERHGGRIWFESRVGHGTTFLFTLPAPQTDKPEGLRLAG